MPEYTYEALATTGARNQGTLTANSEREAMAMLDARGLFPMRITPARSAVGGKSLFSFGRRVKSRHLATFYSQLADLLHAGVPLLRSLDILERQSAQPALSEVLREVRAKVADGTGIAQAMAAYPDVFSELAVSMIRAGQEGGFLEDVLRRVADFTEHQEDLKSKVIGAMAYPVFLMIIGSIVLTILLVFFVPKFEPIFKKLDEQGELPFITQALMAISSFVGHYGIFVLIAGVAAYFGYAYWARTEDGRRIVDRIRLRLPLGAGQIFLNLALSRFTRVLGTLLHNGIPILQALRIAKDSTGNRVLAEAIDRSAENIQAGDSLAKPLEASHHFPRDVVEMVSVGEESNNLENVLIGISESMEKRTGRQLELFVRLLEPVMLLVMAVIIGTVVAALLIPIFKISGAVGK
jgi:general secretion pathway protein F/type IV pilus assembly protein PilC